jgi:glutamate-1-semialdehyde 2,1-aminomutase
METAAGLHLSATYHGETSAMAAAITTLDILDESDVASYVYRLGERLIVGLNESAKRHGIDALAYGEPLPPMPFLRFRSGDPARDDLLLSTFYEEVLRRGLLLHPRHLWFVSRAHSSEDVDRALSICDAAFAVVRERHEALLRK